MQYNCKKFAFRGQVFQCNETSSGHNICCKLYVKKAYFSIKGMCVAGGEDDADGGYYILCLLAALSHLFHRQTWIMKQINLLGFYISVCSHAI